MTALLSPSQPRHLIAQPGSLRRLDRVRVKYWTPVSYEQVSYKKAHGCVKINHYELIANK